MLNCRNFIQIKDSITTVVC